MQNVLEINNFKSIKNLKQNCTRINIFIGEPNTGKSNILEALGFLSFSQFSQYGALNQFIRYNRTSNLFYDEFIDKPFNIKVGPLSTRIQFADGQFTGILDNSGSRVSIINGNYNQLKVSVSVGAGQKPHVKFYKFTVLTEFPRPESEYLLPPDGKNLLSLLLNKRDLRSVVNDIFSRYRLKLVLKPHENLIEIIKEIEGVLISYPYLLISDTLQRVIFHLSAVLSNKDSILVFEEPESHAFPYYTKYLAEIMALDTNNNQYFIATHNPYFLEPVIEKSPKEDISIFITYFEDYQTKVKRINQDEIEDLMHIDIFSNLDKYLKPA